ncbi:preprotein translocase subunit SecG [Prolixibacter bellariivorans]|uniref:Protein-export membrane protein SecG n=2 Tax=Prolixibacter bellariivorans TaxID=314319 RepID=A0A5M4AZ51_9BACT|nr:preprotein translocase subunit SecG [Prolixibacter bellariivorans]GET33064.1 preprotein translocase subunit SecG [Prolixibacter bellariivorans]
MYTLITVLIFIVCVLMILIVLVQNSKGGGLTSTFSGSNQVMGVRKTTDFLEKATWYLAGALFILSISASAFIPRQGVQQRSAIEKQIENAADPTELPTFPQAAPQQQDSNSATQQNNGK